MKVEAAFDKEAYLESWPENTREALRTDRVRIPQNSGPFVVELLEGRVSQVKKYLRDGQAETSVSRIFKNTDCVGTDT